MRAARPVGTDSELIRLGADKDGGYLIPDDLEGIVACYSPGVDQVSCFEMDCANRGMRVFLADGSVDAPAKSHELFEFSKINLAGKSSEHAITMDQWIEETLGTKKGDLLLQMDIEGHEYDVLEFLSLDLLKKFRILVIEFHSITYMSPRMYAVFKKLLDTHYCVHIHPNNCSQPERQFGVEVSEYMEFTFYRKDRVRSSKKRIDFPHKLDKDNTDRQTVVLPVLWYR